MTFNIDTASKDELEQALGESEQLLQALADKQLSLDLTRGKPCTEQLALADELDGILANEFQSDGVDLRNYGGLDGILAAKQLFAQTLGCKAESMFVGGNSSLSLMHYTILFCHHFGLAEGDIPWSQQGSNTKFICPCPGYDRHFSLCREFGIEMIPVALTGEGPDMDEVERLVANDPAIAGIWCVPRFSNPTGEVYSDATVERIAALGKTAGKGFKVLWDNAYAVHALSTNAPALANIEAYAETHGTSDNVIQFGSTSKITFAGAGIGYLATSERNLAGFKRHFGMASIGSDKTNQARHVRFLRDIDGVRAHMAKHAEIIAPKFSIVEKALSEQLGDSGMGNWGKPEGGYFVAFDSRDGLATAIVELAAQSGVKLTPAGATFPNGEDPRNSNIRIAPTYPGSDELEQAMEVFTLCVKIVSIRQELGKTLV